METWRWNHHNVENTTSAKYKMSYRHDWTYPYGVILEKVANKRSKMDDKSNTQWKPPATVSIATDFTIQDTADIQKENTDLQDYYWTSLEAMLRAQCSVCSSWVPHQRSHMTLILSLIYVFFIKAQRSSPCIIVIIKLSHSWPKEKDQFDLLLWVDLSVCTLCIRW